MTLFFAKIKYLFFILILSVISFCLFFSASPAYALVGKGADAYEVQIGASGLLSGYVNSQAVTAQLTEEKWYEVELVYDGSEQRIYVNGILQDSAALSGAINTNNSTFYIGTSTAEAVIDEVKIYNYARTQRQIMLDYNGGGPVGYWKFDEGYASTTYDGSGYGHDGTLMDNTLWTMNGKFDKALSFDGANDYVNVGNISASSSAVSFWVYASNDTKDIIDFDSGAHSIEVASGVVSATGFVSPVIYVDGVESTNLTTGVWHQIAVTTDTEFAVSNLQVGTEASYFEGKIDEVKIYNYVRTAAEIKQDYNSGGGASGKGSAITLGSKRNAQSTWNDGGFGGDAPVGYWRFEEGSGQNVYDSAGNLNNGLLGTTTVAASDDPSRKNGGKIGAGLWFGDDMVSIPDSASLDISGSFTLRFWVKPETGCGTITDADGNNYNTVWLGNQCWQASNMRTTKRPDNGYGLGKGPATHGGGGWTSDLGYYSCPPNSTNDGEDCGAAATLGMLYQWSAAMASSTTAGAQGICPSGWHIPTHDEWTTLERQICWEIGNTDCVTQFPYDIIATGYRGQDTTTGEGEGSALAGDTSDQGWTSQDLNNQGADTNDFGTSGFNLPPAGGRFTNSYYSYRASYGYVWSSLVSGTHAWRRGLNYTYTSVYRNSLSKAIGFSVRCLQD
jgi:uncharacterized protein (TIGR02145 family)